MRAANWASSAGILTALEPVLEVLPCLLCDLAPTNTALPPGTPLLLQGPSQRDALWPASAPEPGPVPTSEPPSGPVGSGVGDSEGPEAPVRVGQAIVTENTASQVPGRQEWPDAELETGTQL